MSATLGIPSSDSRSANLYFLDVVQQANTVFHLFDKQFNDHLMPLIRLVRHFHLYSSEYYVRHFKSNMFIKATKEI